MRRFNEKDWKKENDKKLVSGWFLSSAPEARAIDPVTIAILTPIAIKAAQVAAPYILKGLTNMGKASLKIFPRSWYRTFQPDTVLCDGRTR